ncbi:MAG: hypothetical protein QNL16_10515 [Rhodobacterales bacterium]
MPTVLGDGERPAGPSGARTVRAEVLRYLILGGCKKCCVDESGIDLVGAYVSGALDLNYATAKHRINLDKCRFENAVEAMQLEAPLVSLQGSFLPGLNLQRAKIQGGVFLRNKFHATGEVSLSGAVIGGQLDCSNGRFDNALGQALNAHSVQVTGAVFLKGDFHATGKVSLSGAVIGGQLSCIKGRFEKEKGDALNAQRMRVKASFFWQGVRVDTGSINLNAASVGDLVDDMSSWPLGGRVNLDGFTYERIAGAATPTDAKTRLDWLSRGDTWKGVFFPQPYEQLAKVLGEMGHHSDRRQVLLEKETKLAAYQLQENIKLRQDLRAKRDAKPAPADHSDLCNQVGWLWFRINLIPIWTWLLRVVVGFGYAPQRAAYWAIRVITVATLFYMATYNFGGMVPSAAVVLVSDGWQASMAAAPDMPAQHWLGTDAGLHYERFSALAFAADVFIPLIDFGQESTWSATTAKGAASIGFVAYWATWFIKISGWFITALGAAAITGIIRRD